MSQKISRYRGNFNEHVLMNFYEDDGGKSSYLTSFPLLELYYQSKFIYLSTFGEKLSAKGYLCLSIIREE